MNLNIFDSSGSRVRQIGEEELLALSEAEREIAIRFIAAALDCQDIGDELHQAERELRRLQAAEDAAIIASAKAGPPQDFLEARNAVIAANS
ncbi:hypothetical protein G6321_00050285 [Bradyrhizobium barranii subsp. barranii]|uniref:Uncharacterized protein n=1 Tax=Bradyrhizobium barranii subsp. barranii TaxID=2823807 RepID=A0A7Z0TN34_9BRAD|nr:hypothetical protein [Bradyrhizobium barranii]UGX93685.1 hypothetical protein G6321_00050285 [Bradyrhizobium barranii subsp. barranii]